MGSKHSKGTTYTSDPVPFAALQLPFAALQEATINFDDKFFIAEGIFGKVYRGVLRDGTNVALKRHNRKYHRSIEEFQTEIEILSQFRQPNLVSLIRYCNDNNEMILIFEYLENGNLCSHLYGSDLPTLGWEQRLEICIGAARGLHYLHTSRIIHRDVKPSNILLDENFVPKIADFGISRKGTDLDQTHLSTRIIGTVGYIAPEYNMMGQLTEKSDVYSFGVVLFQVLCAPRNMVRLIDWAVESQKKGQLEQIIDPNLLVKIKPESLRKFGETAVKCLAGSGVDRPSMSDVQWNLEYALHLQEPVIPDDPEEDSSFPIRELSPLINDFTHVDASSNVSQVGISNLDDISSDELIRPR